MISVECMLNRCNFLRGSAGMAVGLCTVDAFLESAVGAENAWIIGPQSGFTPDYLLDANANTIGRATATSSRYR